MKQKVWGLVLAAEKTTDAAGSVEPAFLYLNDRPVLAYSLTAFMQCPDIDGVIIVINRERAESALGMVQLYGFSKVKKIVMAGARRSTSMTAALEHVDDSVDWICVHDATFPLLSPALISETIKSAKRYGSGVAATEVLEPVVTAKRHVVTAKLPEYPAPWCLLYPQTYPAQKLFELYPKTAKTRKNHKDETTALLDAGEPLRLVPAPPTVRIRTVDDLVRALAIDHAVNVTTLAP